MKEIIYNIKKKLGILKTREMADYYRSKGINIGKGTYLFSTDIIIDTQRPYMIEIGEYCKITKGVIILQHDYSRSVLRRKYGEIIGESKKTIIGNNVFIGVNSIILMGTNIGDNVIVGAGSVVSGNIPSDVVIAGNPAKIICSLSDYYNKRKSKYIEEACLTAKCFYSKYNRFPECSELGAFWPIFTKKDFNEININKINTNLNGDDFGEALDFWLNSKEEQQFSSYEDFIEYVKSTKK